MGGEKKFTVAFLGPKGSYCHQAALQSYPPSDGHTLIPHPSIPSIFIAVQNASVDRGVAPYENSTNGSVVQTLDLLADVKRENASVRVCGEAYVPVQHCLLGRRPESIIPKSEAAEKNKDLRDFSHIQRLYSHPQAWTQCTPFISKYIPQCVSSDRQIDTTSTSNAAELVTKDTTGTSAAICSFLCAELYGLDVLAQGIEEKKGNTTKFLLLRQSPDQVNSSISTSSQSEPSESTCPSETPSPPPSAPPKTLLTFTVPHLDPGALARAISIFGIHGINLTAMNSRPSGERAWHYLFFVEFEGQRGYPNVDAALKKLDGAVEGWRVCGSWRSGSCTD